MEVTALTLETQLPPPPDRASGLNGSVYGRSLGTYIFDLYPQFFNSTPSELRYF